MDACGISNTDYDELKKGWVESIGKPGVYSVSPHHFVVLPFNHTYSEAITAHHNWAFKRVDFGDASEIAGI
jgi:hypothetical protein